MVNYGKIAFVGKSLFAYHVKNAHGIAHAANQLSQKSRMNALNRIGAV